MGPMTGRRPSRLGFVLSAILILGTTVEPASMALVAAAGNVPAGHHHGHSHAPGKSPLSSCCDLCWGECGTAPAISPRVELPVVLLTETAAPPIENAGLLTALPVAHRLPFAQGPPTFLS